MDTKKHEMLVMHIMCQKEINQLQINLSNFVQESGRVQELLRKKSFIYDISSNNVFALIAFDRYMSHLVTVLNMARKFNIHLQINDLRQSIMNAATSGCLNDHNLAQTQTLQDFFEWSGTRLENVSNLTDIINSLDINDNVNCKHKDFSTYDESADGMKTVKISNGCLQCAKKTERECATNISADTFSKMEDFVKILLPTKNLDHFTNDYEFYGYIMHVQDYKELVFFICERDDFNILRQFSNSSNLVHVPHSNLWDDVFCVLQTKDSTENESVWRAIIVPDEKVDCQKLAYLLDSGEIIQLTDQCAIYKAPPSYKRIYPLAVKCCLDGVQDPLKCMFKDQDKCEQILHENIYKKVFFRVNKRQRDILHVVFIENSTNDVDNIEALSNKKISSFDDGIFEEEKDNPHTSDHTPHFTLNKRDELCTNIQIIVTHVVSPLTFYAIIQNDLYDNNKTFSWHDHEITTSQKQVFNPQLNDIVLSQYYKDKYWYRAKIIDIDKEHGLYKVFYVDFGNTELVPQCCLASCAKEHLEDPLRASLFHLANLSIVTLDDNTNEATSNRIQSRIQNAIQSLVIMILDQILNVNVVERRNDEYFVHLIDDQYAGIPKMLIDMGVAEEV